METCPLSTESLEIMKSQSCRQYSDFDTHTPVHLYSILLKGCCSLETKGVVPVEHKTAAAFLGNGLCSDQLDRLLLPLTEVGVAYLLHQCGWGSNPN